MNKSIYIMFVVALLFGGVACSTVQAGERGHVAHDGVAHVSRSVAVDQVGAEGYAGNMDTAYKMQLQQWNLAMTNALAHQQRTNALMEMVMMGYAKEGANLQALMMSGGMNQLREGRASGLDQRNANPITPREAVGTTELLYPELKNAIRAMIVDILNEKLGDR